MSSSSEQQPPVSAEKPQTAGAGKKMEQSSLHDQLTDPNLSAFRRYQKLAVGSDSLWYLIKFELIMLLTSGLSGALGLLLRKHLYPHILGSVGRNVVFGRNLSIRHGLKIRIGDGTVVDDNATLDAKGESNKGIDIGPDCIISKNAILSCKNADITIGRNSMVGINALVHAVEGSNVTIGDDALIAAFVYLMATGTYGSEELDTPFKKQGVYARGGVHLSDNVWLGSSVQIMDGVSIGKGAIVGSGAVVTRSVADYEVAGGIPAKTIRSRKASA